MALVFGIVLTGVVDRVESTEVVVEWRRGPCEVLGWTHHAAAELREGEPVRATLRRGRGPRSAQIRAFLDTGRAPSLRLQRLRERPARVHPRRCRAASPKKENRHE